MRSKGFVVSAVLYPLLVLFLTLMIGILSMIDVRKRVLDKMKLEISNSIFEEEACSCDTILNKLNYIIKNGVGGSSGGGSSYISGHAGCIAIDKNGNSLVSVYSELNDSISYTGHQFLNTVMIDGQGYQWTMQKNSYVKMPTYDGTSTMTANTGNGYAKITYLGES